MKILLIITEIYWIALIISALLRRGFPTDSVFWIAAAIEVALGFLTYNVHKRYLTDKSYRRWSFLGFLLALIGIGVPITLFYTIDFLKPAGGTWAIYLLTVNSCYLYRIIKKEPIARGPIPTGSLLTRLRIIHSVFLATVLIMILVLALLPLFGFVPLLSGEGSDLVLGEIVFAIFILPMLVIGIFLHRIIGWVWKTDRSDMYVYYVSGIRLSFFEVIAFLGLLLGIFGSAWYIWLPLLMLTGIAMVFTFPTAQRWAKWQAG